MRYLSRFAQAITAFVATVSLCFTSQAQSPSAVLDQSFAVGIGSGFPAPGSSFWPQVQSVAVQPDGKVLAGGQSLFTNFNGSPIRALCRINIDGSLDTAFVSNLGTGPTISATGGAGEINRILVQADGKILICGDFDALNGFSRSRIARLNADGSVDTSFLASGEGVGGSTFRYLEDIALQPDGKIIIGGGFSNFSGVGRQSLARLHPDGTLDTSFTHGAPSGFNVPSTVRSVGVQNDGKILVGGVFTNWAGLGGTPGIVRLLPTGEVDMTFVPQHKIPFPSVQVLQPTADGRVLVGGFIEGTATTTTRYFARLNGDGSLDTSFPVGPDGWVADIQPWPAGGYLVSGRFQRVSGQLRGELALVDENGNLDLGFAPQPYATGDLVHIYTHAVAPDGKIIFGGWLTNYPNGTQLNGQDYAGVGRLIGGFVGGSGKIQFTSASTIVNEDAGSITISVSRFGGASGAASVNFTTSAGSAGAGSDFSTTSGTLSWNDGEVGIKTLTVPIESDATAESSESFTVVLSSPTGATIGVNGTLTVNIRDDDSVPTITRQPLDASVFLTFPVTFSVGIDSALPVTYQWLSNDVAIPGATSPFLTLTNVQTNFGPSYSIQISNSIGAITSSVATLTVVIPAGLPNPQFTTPGVGLNGDIYDLRFQADGKLVAVGAFNQYGGTNLPNGLIRLNADGSRDTTFPAVATGVSGSSAYVQSIVPAPDGKWIITGNFTSYNGTNRLRVARLNADGTLDPTFVPNVSASTIYAAIPQADGKLLVGDSSFVRRLMPNGTNDTTFANAALVGQVYSMVQLPDGKVLASAYRSSAPSGAEIVRLNLDGTRDFSFAGPGRFSGTISKMSLLPDGRIFISGGFTTVASNTSTNPLPYVAMLTPEGMLDTNFVAQTSDGSVIHHIVQPDGRILLGGAFTSWNGVPAGRYVRLLPNGTIDPTFVYGAGANNFVRAVAIDGSGRYAIGGSFTQVNQQPRGKIAILTEGAGTLQLTPGSQIVTEQTGTVSVSIERVAGSRGPVSVSYASSAGTAAAGSDFTAVSGTLSWLDGEAGVKTFDITISNDVLMEEDETFSVALANPVGGAPFGLFTNQVITILDDESLPRLTQQPLSLTLPEEVAATFSVSAYSALPFTYQWRSNGVNIANATNHTLTLLNVQSNFAASYSVRLSNVNGSVDSSNAVLTVIASPTRRDLTFNPPSAFNGAVRAIVPLGDGRALVGGDFTQPRNRIALINFNGAVDLSFTNTASGGSNPGIYDIERDHWGRWLIAGSFTNFGGVNFSNIVRLNADFTVDTNFLVALGKAPNGVVRDVTVGPDGKIWLAGDFTSVAGPYGLSYLARLYDNGTPDLEMFPRSNGSIYKVFPLANGKAFIAGSFGSYHNSGGSFRRINADGSGDTTFFVNTSGAVYDILMLPDGGFYVAGAISSPTARIAKFDAGGKADSIFTGGASANSGSSVNSIALQANGRLIGVGSFTNFGIHSYRFTRMETNGLQDTTLATGVGFNQEAYKVAVEPTGGIWVGGSFTQYKGQSAPYLIRLFGDETKLAITAEPSGRMVGAGENTTFSVSAVGNGLTYQWYRNGVVLTDTGAFSGTQTASMTISGVSNHSDIYSVTVTDISGATVSTRGAWLWVVNRPDFVTQPASVRVPLGGRIFLSAVVEGAAPIAFQWYHGGIPVGGNSPHLVLSNATLDLSGIYQLVASNSRGSATSEVAVVTVEMSPASAAPGFFPDAGGYNTFDLISALQPLPDGRLMIGGAFATLKTNGTGQVYRQNLALFATNGLIDPFDAGISAQVNDVVRQRDGKIVVAGQFTSVSNGIVQRRYLARFNADLTLDMAFHSALGTGPDQGVADIALQADGKLIIGGGFASVSGKPNTRAIARLNADGSVDESLASQIANFGTVSVVDVLPDGRILLTANNSYGGHNASVYRISSSGEIDFTYAPSVGGAVTALAVQTNGGVIIGGTFTQPNGINRPLLARLTPSGALDTNFFGGITNFTASNQAVIRSIAIQDNGRILAGGNFLSFGPFRNGLARFNADGTADTSFAFQQGLGDDSNAEVSRIALFADGRIAIAGRFATWEGISENSLAILNGDVVELGFASQPIDQFVLPGSTVQFNVNAVGTPTISYQWFRGDTALTDAANISGATAATLTISNVSAGDAGLYHVRIANSSGERLSLSAELFVLGAPVFRSQPSGGTFYISNSVSLRAQVLGVTPINYQWYVNETNAIVGATNTTLALLNISLTNAGAYTLVASNVIGVATSAVAEVEVRLLPNSVSSAFAHPAGANGSVYAIAPLNDGRVVIGGTFNSAGLNGNQTSRLNLALLNTNGTVDATFSPAPNGNVEVVVAHNGGFLVGGQFTSIAGQSRSYFARLNADGSIDTNFMANLGVGPSHGVYDIAVRGDGKIMVAGMFNQIGGQSHPGIVRLNANGSIDSTFKINGSPMTIYTISLLNDGRLYAGGFLSLSNRQNIVLLKNDGSVDLSFSATVNSSVNDLAALSDGGVLLGGYFSIINGSSAPFLARLNADGILEAWPAARPNSGVSRLTVQQDGKAVVVGDFSSISSITQNRIVRYNSDGTRDAAFSANPGLNSTTRTVALRADGGIWVGGSFTSFNGTPANNIVLLTGDPLEAPALTPFEQWTLLVGLTGPNSGPGVDADGDGVSNVFEYYLGTNPNDAASNPASPLARRTPQATAFANVGGQFYPVMSYIRSKTAPGVVAVAQASADLTFSNPISTVEHSVTDLGDGTERVLIRSSVAASVQTTQFMRLQLTLQ